MKSHTGRTAHRGHAETTRKHQSRVWRGDHVHDVKENRQEWGQKGGAKFHDGMWLGLRMKSDESVIPFQGGSQQFFAVPKFSSEDRILQLAVV